MIAAADANSAPAPVASPDLENVLCAYAMTDPAPLAKRIATTFPGPRVVTTARARAFVEILFELRAHGAALTPAIVKAEMAAQGRTEAIESWQREAILDAATSATPDAMQDTLDRLVHLYRRREIAAALERATRIVQSPGATDDDVVQAARSLPETLDRVGRSGAAAVGPNPDAPLPFRTLRKVTADVQGKPRPPALWPGFVACGQVAALAGAPKSGKTEVAFAWAAALSRGSEWLGTHPDATDVILVTEESDADLVDKLSRYGAELDRVHVLNPDGGAGVPTFCKLVADVEALAGATGARACVLDTFAAWGGLTGDDERNEGVVGPLVRLLRPLKAAGLATLLLHHTVKDAEADGVAAVRGSGALAAEVEGFAVFREAGRGAPEGRRTLRAWTRSYGKATQVIERVAPNDGADVYYRLVTDDPERDAKAAGFRASDRKVIDALTRVGGWLPKASLLEATALGDRTLDGALAGLVAADKVLRKGRGVNGSPFLYAIPGTPAEVAEEGPQGNPA